MDYLFMIYLSILLLLLLLLKYIITIYEINTIIIKEKHDAKSTWC